MLFVVGLVRCMFWVVGLSVMVNGVGLGMRLCYFLIWVVLLFGLVLVGEGMMGRFRFRLICLGM